MNELSNDSWAPVAAAGANRRQLLVRAGLAGAAAVGASLLGSAKQGVSSGALVEGFRGTSGKAFKVNAYDVLNFALNLEYLEAEFYLRATTGAGLPADLIGKKPGNVTAGSTPVPFVAGSSIGSLAAAIAADELNHVRTLRSVLGLRAVDRPAIDLTDAFNTLATTVGIVQSPATFDPFANEDNFLLGAFLFEDVGVTAYHGALPFFPGPNLQNDVSGILAVEAYHAGAIRALLYARGQTTTTDISNANDLAALRETASDAQNGPNPTDAQLASSAGDINLAPADSSGVALSRSFSQVLNIVYLNTSSVLKAGGFFPSGLNGRIA